MTSLHLVQVMDMESPGFNASACAWVVMCSICIISCSAARASPGVQTANAKTTASPKPRLILLRRLCFVFITVSFISLCCVCFIVEGWVEDCVAICTATSMNKFNSLLFHAGCRAGPLFHQTAGDILAATDFAGVN